MTGAARAMTDDVGLGIILDDKESRRNLLSMLNSMARDWVVSRSPMIASGIKFNGVIPCGTGLGEGIIPSDCSHRRDLLHRSLHACSVLQWSRGHRWKGRG